MNNPKKLLIAAALLCASWVSHADTVTYEVPIAGSDRDWAQTVSVPRFKAKLGRLNSVTLTIRGTAASSATFLHLGSSYAQLTVFDVSHTFRACAPGLLAQAFNVSSAEVPVLLRSGEPQSFVFPEATVTGSDATIRRSGWLGEGMVNIATSCSVIAEYGFSASGWSQLTSTVWSQSSAVVVVTYDYTPRCR